MSSRRIIEGRWACSSCSTKDILGRHKVCPACGNPREAADGETKFDFGETSASGGSTTATVTDADALGMAEAGADWHCAACGAANRGDHANCRSCGAAPGEAPATEPGTDPTPERPKRNWLKPMLVVVGLVGLGVFWATRTQELAAEPSRTWTHTVNLERFVPLTTGGWKHTLNDRAPVMPVDGSGEVAGVQRVRDCHEKESGTRKVADGTERVCSQRTRQVQDGTTQKCTTRDLGNGFAEEICEDVPTYRNESYEECEDQTRYRDEPVYDTWCTYDTWTWKSIDQASHSGGWETPVWPELETGPLDRQRRSQAYVVVLTYPWRKGSEQYTVEPQTLTDFERWQEGVKVPLTVNNLGKVVDLKP